MLGVIVCLLAAFIAGAFEKWIALDDLLKLSGILLTPLIGIFGTVLGFYFGEKAR